MELAFFTVMATFGTMCRSTARNGPPPISRTDVTTLREKNMIVRDSEDGVRVLSRLG